MAGACALASASAGNPAVRIEHSPPQPCSHHLLPSVALHRQPALELQPFPRIPNAPAMASAAQDVFDEHLGVISALRDNYARTEDASAVAGLVRAQQEVAAACSQREEQVKEAIKGAPGGSASVSSGCCLMVTGAARPLLLTRT